MSCVLLFSEEQCRWGIDAVGGPGVGGRTQRDRKEERRKRRIEVTFPLRRPGEVGYPAGVKVHGCYRYCIGGIDPMPYSDWLTPNEGSSVSANRELLKWNNFNSDSTDAPCYAAA